MQIMTGHCISILQNPRMQPIYMIVRARHPEGLRAFIGPIKRREQNRLIEVVA